MAATFHGHLILLLLAASCCCGETYGGSLLLPRRETRKLCGKAFEYMYFSGSCNQMGKRSNLHPSTDQSGSSLTFQLISVEDKSRLKNSLKRLLMPRPDERHHSDKWLGAAPSSHRLFRRHRNRLPRLPERRMVFPKRSPEDYNRLHNFCKLCFSCCQVGCSREHFNGVC